MSRNNWLHVNYLWHNKVAALIACTAATAFTSITLTAPSASAAYITVYGGPTYTPGVGGFKTSGSVSVNNGGTAIGTSTKFDALDNDLGDRAVSWDGAGAAAFELESWVPFGTAASRANAINNSGTVVGRILTGVIGYYGDRAVRWDASGTAATLLGNLGTSSAATRLTYSNALAINDAGTAVGWVQKWVGPASNTVYKGERAVRWNASGTAATELGHLGTDTSGVTFAEAFAVNNAGAAVGQADKFDASGVEKGNRAVRWDASGTAATELGNLGTDPRGVTYSAATDINDAGAAIGRAMKYDGSGVTLGWRAVRWGASGTAPTELGNLGTDPGGYTLIQAGGINDAGTAIGLATKYDASGAALGDRAVRWDASGTAATELGDLETGSSGDVLIRTYAGQINDAGTVVGSIVKYDDSGMLLSATAVYWGLDAVAVDLDTLVDPASGWTLNSANAISDTGWIGGSGDFDPDGPGGQAPYQRLFLMHVPATAVGPTLPGDLDFDRDVDGADFLSWQRGESPNPLSAADLAEWQAHFGQTPPMVGAGSSAAAVPEPATAVLFAAELIAVFGSFFHRSQLRRKRHGANHRRAVRRPRFEPLEDRCLLAFRAPIFYGTDSNAYAVVTADFNGDGRLDLAATNQAPSISGSHVSIYLGNGDGSFQDARTYATDLAPTAIAAGDFNGDGKLDLVTGHADDDEYSEINLLLGNGDGSFQSWTPTWFYGSPGDAPSDMAVGDFDADGNLDLAVSISNGASRTQISVLLGSGQGGFENLLNFWAPSGPDDRAIVAADFNHDGDADLALGNSAAAVVDVFLSNGDGTFQPAHSYATADYSWSVSVADLNGDGKIDLVTSSNHLWSGATRDDSASVLLGNGDGTFQATQNYAGLGRVGDFNRDGSLDLLVGTSLLSGEGNDAEMFPASGGPETVGDFNGDGRWDLADTFSVLLNDGVWPAAGPALPGDFNGDGNVDGDDLAVWQSNFGSSGAIVGDGNGDHALDGADFLIWQRNVGSAPAPAASSLSVMVDPDDDALAALAEPKQRRAIEPQDARAPRGPLGTIDSQLPQSIARGKAAVPLLPARQPAELDEPARGNDLRLIHSSGAHVDQHLSSGGLNSRSIKESTEEARETQCEALDVVFTTLEPRTASPRLAAGERWGAHWRRS